jgi:putative membrane protein
LPDRVERAVGMKAFARPGPDPLRGAVVGAIAGLAAAAAMNVFQSVAQRLAPGAQGSGDSADVRAADRLVRAAGGAPLDEATRPVAGAAMHYALGLALGAGYGVAAEYRPAVTAGNGAAFGSVAALVLDEAVVPATGLASPPGEVPAPAHLFGLSSHLVFGATTEMVRSFLVGLLRR